MNRSSSRRALCSALIVVGYSIPVLVGGAATPIADAELPFGSESTECFAAAMCLPGNGQLYVTGSFYTLITPSTYSALTARFDLTTGAFAWAMPFDSQINKPSALSIDA